MYYWSTYSWGISNEASVYDLSDYVEEYLYLSGYAARYTDFVALYAYVERMLR